jgi:TonB family protein
MILALLLAALAPQVADEPGAPRPDGDIAAWFGPGAYPEEAIRQHASGRVGFMVDVDPVGVPVTCTVTESSGAASLDDGTCAIIMRAHFIAGHDAAGAAIAGRYSNHVRWVMPEDPPGTAQIKIVDLDLGTCSFKLDGKPRHLTPMMCRNLIDGMRKAGQSIEDRISLELPDTPEVVLPEGQ